jgi:UDP-N-acetylmuramyl pentapeptide phosphotransferase/UDP-N-acetylglucosamine-1-phosphate transferase
MEVVAPGIFSASPVVFAISTIFVITMYFMFRKSDDASSEKVNPEHTHAQLAGQA